MSLVPALDLRDRHPNAPGPDIEHLPANVEAEAAILGTILYDNQTFETLAGVLRADHFSEPFHQRLFAAIEREIQAGGLAELFILSQKCAQDPGFEQLGGVTYLADLIDRAPPVANAPQYAKAVIEAATRRDLLRLMGGVSARLRDPGEDDVDAIIAELEEGAAEVSLNGVTSDRWLNPSDMIGAAIAKAKASKGIIEFPSGLPDLDRMLGGLHRQEVTILAARSGMGKTVGAQVFAKETARSGRATLFYSLEMGDDPMALRLACDLTYDRDAAWYTGAESNVTLEKIARNELYERQWERLEESRRTVAEWPLRYDIRPAMTMARIEALARRQFRDFERQGIPRGLIIIDHLGKVKPAKDRKGNKHAETADVSAEASEMAKRLDVPVLLLCQLNRQVEGRNDKLPILSDLRQAGEIEEDARQVVFLYRPEYYLRAPADGESAADRVEREAKLHDVRGKLFWIVEKNSNGPRGQVLTYCDMAASAVREWR